MCNGSGCRQRGADAAYLELEELVTELASQRCNGSGHHDISLERVGCSHQCDRAPVVQIRVTQRGSTTLQPTIMLSMEGPSQCKSALDSALAELGAAPGAAEAADRTAGGAISGLMRRRAESLRWEALRALSRAHDSKALREGWVLFQKAADADEKAANGDAHGLQRARVRSLRMRSQVALLNTS